MNMKNKILFLIWAIGFVFNLGYSQELIWHEIQNGIWKASVGEPEKIGLLQSADISPKEEALQEMPAAKFPLNKTKISTKVVDGKTYLRFPLTRDEQIYGLGLNFKTVHQRGRIMQLHVDHYDGIDNGRTHAAVPFYVSSHGYGVLIDAARYITVYAGTGISVDADDKPI